MSKTELPASVEALFYHHYPLDHPATEILSDHSRAVCALALQIGATQKARLEFLAEAAWLHDIGIRYTHAPGIGCTGHEPYLRHGVIGRQICEEAGLPEHALVCERHLGTGLTAEEIRENHLPLPERDMLPLTLEERIICFADQFFSKGLPGILSTDQVRSRIRRHGATSLARFESLEEEFGSVRQ